MPVKDLIAHYADMVRALPVAVSDVVLILRDNVVEVANAFADQLPGATIHVLDDRGLTAADADRLGPGVLHGQAESTQARLHYLARVPPPQVIVEAGTNGRREKLGNLRHLYYRIQAGGLYVVADVAACWDAREASLSQRDLRRRLMELTNLQTAPQNVSFLGGAAIIRKATDHLFKLREWEVDEVLRARFGSAWGESALIRPARSFVSRALVTSHGSGPISGGQRTLEIPAMRLRLYRDALCPSLQIAVSRDYVLPDTFRHLHQRVLAHRHLHYATAYFAQLKPKYTPEKPRRLVGSYYLLDTEHPGHFGHITTEVLSRCWGWPLALEADPSLRVLLSSNRPPATVPGFQREIFKALGIPLERVEVIHPFDVVEVERLVAATPQFENPYYVDPELAAVWRRLVEGLLPRARAVSPAKIFVSRRPAGKRNCYEALEIEQFFARHGFHVFYPEDLSFADQASLFANARVVAGLGGSNMFTMLAAPQARILIIAGDGYNAENEHLIAAANGNELHYFWGRSDLQTAEGFSQLDAARSDFHFDLAQHQRDLEAVSA